MRKGSGAALVVLVGTALSVPAAGVGSRTAPPRSLGQPEGKLSLLQWPGYSAPSFAAAFERRTGCRITRRALRSSAEMVDLMKKGRYDLVSASGDVSGTLIARRLVQPVNVALVPAWRQLPPQFRSPAFNTVKGVHYGVTVLWTPNVLLFNTERAKPQPSQWRAIYDDRFRGKVSVPDNPMQIADAALYLRATRPDLGIRDPYALTRAQFDAAVALLRRQRPLVVRYWQYATEQIQDFRTGAAVVGWSWPYQAQVLAAADVSVRQIVPRQGATAWADSWMLGRRARHPNCAHLWLRYVLSASVQADEALALRESPVNPKACRLMNLAEEGSCAAYYAASPKSVLRRLAFWKTPSARCRPRGKRRCVPYADWRKAWIKIVG
jgi:putative spermidine/putrescine transport system substrate-binding protein